MGPKIQPNRILQRLHQTITVQLYDSFIFLAVNSSVTEQTTSMRPYRSFAALLDNLFCFSRLSSFALKEKVWFLI